MHDAGSHRRLGRCALLVALLAPAAPLHAHEADLILVGGRVWTGDRSRPEAETVAMRGDRILAVGSAEEVLAHRGKATRVVDLAGRLVAPGFIDNHTHFNRAGELILGVNLLDVADEDRLVHRVREARDRLPAGAWIVGGDWGAYEAWGQGSAGGERAGEEHLKGTLTPGLLADLVVLDRDPFAVPPAEIKDLEVHMTILGGEVVFEAGAESDP